MEKLEKFKSRAAIERALRSFENLVNNEDEDGILYSFGVKTIEDLKYYVSSILFLFYEKEESYGESIKYNIKIKRKDDDSEDFESIIACYEYWITMDGTFIDEFLEFY